MIARWHERATPEGAKFARLAGAAAVLELAGAVFVYRSSVGVRPSSPSPSMEFTPLVI